MQFLAIIDRKTGDFTEDEFAKYMEPEAEYVRALYTKGVFRNVYSRGDVKGAVLEIEASTLEEATATLNDLPFAQQGMVDFKVIPLLPYRGFAPRG